ncbi:MAG: hypothetical protein H0V66_07005 [Bdellovibrionales bacterium]|nr:hypothetical protein [Bdellovibrionales bacterium]
MVVVKQPEVKVKPNVEKNLSDKEFKELTAANKRQTHVDDMLAQNKKTLEHNQKNIESAQKQLLERSLNPKADPEHTLSITENLNKMHESRNGLLATKDKFEKEVIDLNKKVDKIKTPGNTGLVIDKEVKQGTTKRFDTESISSTSPKTKVRQDITANTKTDVKPDVEIKDTKVREPAAVEKIDVLKDDKVAINKITKDSRAPVANPISEDIPYSLKETKLNDLHKSLLAQQEELSLIRKRSYDELHKTNSDEYVKLNSAEKNLKKQLSDIEDLKKEFVSIKKRQNETILNIKSGKLSDKTLVSKFDEFEKMENPAHKLNGQKKLLNDVEWDLAALKRLKKNVSEGKITPDDVSELKGLQLDNEINRLQSAQTKLKEAVP